MKNFISKLTLATHRFNVVDFAIFKICLLTIGILFGAYFSPFFQTYILVIWILAIITWVVLMIKLIYYFSK